MEPGPRVPGPDVEPITAEIRRKDNLVLPASDIAWHRFYGPKGVVIRLVYFAGDAVYRLIPSEGL